MKVRAGFTFTPDRNDEHLEGRPYFKIKPGRIGLFAANGLHNLTHLKADQPDGPRPTMSLLATRPNLPTQDEIVAKAGGIIERTASRTRKAMGRQYEVLVRARSGRDEPVGFCPTLGEAKYRADRVDGVVHDHTAGELVYVSPGYRRRWSAKGGDLPVVEPDEEVEDVESDREVGE